MTVRLAVSVGCPCGIGPEVSAKAALEVQPGVRVLLVSAPEAVLRTVAKRDRARFREVETPEEGWSLGKGTIGIWNPIAATYTKPGRLGIPGRRDGSAQLAWVDAACDLTAAGRADAMVTGPVSKEVIAASGAEGAVEFRGHTEHLQRRLGAREVVMAFFSERFSSSLVSTHLPLSAVPRATTAAAVARAAYWLASLCLALKAGRGPLRIAVCSLNPHAGEGGLFGAEEKRSIVPGIARARARLARPKDAIIEGPIGAETAFRKASLGVYAGVVAMYHDQATIPMKLVGFGESVNVSLGLPIIRTSVDHGTGYDIAPKRIADPRGMREAVSLAIRLARGRSAR